MEIRKLARIKELAQDFLKSPRIVRDDKGLYLMYDFEMDSGDYGEKTIFFGDVKDYRHITEKDITADMMQAYNSVGEVNNSSWIEKKIQAQGFRHFVIYFDGYGFYEVVAKYFLYDSETYFQ